VKATGIVRRIDDLGRVVIPKEIRRTLKIKEGNPLEIYVDREGGVILKKYSPIGELGTFAQEYADSLYESMGHITCIADRDTVIAVAGAPRKEFANRPLSAAVEQVMENRKSVMINNTADHEYYQEADDMTESRFTNEVIAPIISEGDPIGAVILGSRDPAVKMTDLEQKLVETAASFLAKQMAQ
jgi:AbrB family transcriptional regulator, stage V sporulation protein T